MTGARGVLAMLACVSALAASPGIAAGQPDGALEVTIEGPLAAQGALAARLASRLARCQGHAREARPFEAMRARLELDARGRVGGVRIDDAEDRAAPVAAWHHCASRALRGASVGREHGSAIVVAVRCAAEAVEGSAVDAPVPPALGALERPPPTSGLDGLGPGGAPEDLARFSPSVRPGMPEARGALEVSLVRRIVARDVATLLGCYERVPPRRREGGRVELRFVIAPSGEVSEADAVAPPALARSLAPCLVRAARAWRFPAPSDGAAVRVMYPLTFLPGEARGGSR